MWVALCVLFEKYIQKVESHSNEYMWKKNISSCKVKTGRATKPCEGPEPTRSGTRKIRKKCRR